MTHNTEATSSRLVINPEEGTIDRIRPNGQVQKNIGSVVGRGHLIVMHKRKSTYAHRLIYEYVNGPIPSGMQIDHINEIKTDNRIANLRLVTQSQNFQNQSGANARNAVGVKGVCFERRTGKFLAYISIAHRRKFLGRFPTVETAKAAYAYAASILHTHNPCASQQVAVPPIVVERVQSFAKNLQEVI